MENSDLNKEDLKLIKKKGFTPEIIIDQIQKFKKGVLYSNLIRPARLNDGIKKLSEKEKKKSLSIFEEKKSKLKIIKFIPASGAASRMFKELLLFYNNEKYEPNNYIDDFFAGVKENKFAFLSDLKNCMSEYGYDLMKCLKEGKKKVILKYLLTEDGLNYANLPKSVLKFHLYKDNSGTPVHEHINEGIAYSIGLNGKVRIDFTVSSESIEIFKQHIEQAVQKINVNKEILDISLSEQKKGTQTIAVNLDNTLFKLSNGDILFRPSGHGALIENLNDLDGDIIFIKNIDNIAVKNLSSEINEHKKVLGGYLIGIRDKVFDFCRSLEEKKYNSDSINKMVNYCKKKLNIFFERKFDILSVKKKADIIKKKLARPIRVCGMVKNEGEPGGGPFWIKKNNDKSLQIIESASVNNSDKSQIEILRSAEFFNPVDIVCSTKNFKGVKYDLRNFVDNETFFISEKSYKGKTLKALELPGLWNGAMADWITIFIDVPLITFNPVKRINDLLKPNHIS